jgi:hypothetical protein
MPALYTSEQRSENARRAALKLPPSQRSTRASIAALEMHARPGHDTKAHMARARAGLLGRFIAEAGGDPVKAQRLYRAHMLRLSLMSSKARRKTREQGVA